MTSKQYELTPEIRAKVPNYVKKWEDNALLHGITIDRTKTLELFSKWYELKTDDKGNKLSLPPVFFARSVVELLLIYAIKEDEVQLAKNKKDYKPITKELTKKQKEAILNNTLDFFTLPEKTKQTFNNVVAQAQNANNHVMFGNFEVGYLCYHDILIQEYQEQDNKEELDLLLQIGQTVKYYIPCKEALFICEYPLEIHLDENKRLHNDTGAALVYGGIKYYQVHGLTVPSWIIEHPEKITAKSILAERNMEVRRVMLDKFGHAKFLMEIKHKVISTDIDSKGQTRRVLWADNGEDLPIVMVEVRNSSLEPDGTRNMYLLPVHHEGRPFRDGRFVEPSTSQELTPHNLVASTFGLYGNQYGLPGQVRQGDVLVWVKEGPEAKTPFWES